MSDEFDDRGQPEAEFLRSRWNRILENRRPRAAAMPDHLRDFLAGLLASRSEAERWLPRLLELDGPDLSRELERHPELQPGITQGLLARIDAALDRDPSRAHELTTVVVERAPLDLGPRIREIRDSLAAQAWIAHARALHALGRHAEAHEAIAAAYAVCRKSPAKPWLHAVAGVLEARILHALGRSASAVALLPAAGATFLRFGAEGRYAEATILESRIQYEAGDAVAAEKVEYEARNEAWITGRFLRLAHLNRHNGALELRQGRAKEAAMSFERARMIFESSKMRLETARTSWSIAEAAAASGQFDCAVHYYRKVPRRLVAVNEWCDAAIAATELLDLLLVTGRSEKLQPIANTFDRTFTEANLPLQALRAWRFVGARSRAGVLTRQDVAHVRRYFERLPLRPNAELTATA